MIRDQAREETVPTTGLEAERVRRVRDQLGARDWQTVTVSEVAEAAGLSRMTLHRHGISKHTVLEQLTALLASEHREAVFPALVSTEPGVERLRMALRGLCGVNERYLGIIASLGEHGETVFHEPGEGAVLTRVEFTGGVRRIVQDGVADGTLHTEEPEEMATLLFNAAGHTYRHLRLGHRWPVERATSAVVRLLLHGVAAVDEASP